LCQFLIARWKPSPKCGNSGLRRGVHTFGTRPCRLPSALHRYSTANLQVPLIAPERIGQTAFRKCCKTEAQPDPRSKKSTVSNGGHDFGRSVFGWLPAHFRPRRHALTATATDRCTARYLQSTRSRPSASLYTLSRRNSRHLSCGDKVRSSGPDWPGTCDPDQPSGSSITQPKKQAEVSRLCSPLIPKCALSRRSRCRTAVVAYRTAFLGGKLE